MLSAWVCFSAWQRGGFPEEQRRLMSLIDSHSHIDAPEFAHDRDAVIERARHAGVMRQIVPAVTAASWPALRDICDANPGLHSAYGLHPMFLRQHEPRHLQQLADWLAQQRPVAI